MSNRIVSKFVLLLYFQFLIAISFAQDGLKSYIPPSPNAQTFQKYGDYPVNYSTGVPSISIPLYTIALKDYSFPITTSFHASGRMVSFSFSQLGMGWALQATGVISREVKGSPDDKVSSHAEKAPDYYLPHSSHVEELSKLENSGGIIDTEYDIFSLDINGVSVKFIIRDNGDVLFLTYSPYKLQVFKNGLNYDKFILTDDKGIIYKFGAEGGLG